MLAQGVRLLGRVGEELEGLDALAAGLDGTGSRGGGEQTLVSRPALVKVMPVRMGPTVATAGG